MGDVARRNVFRSSLARLATFLSSAEFAAADTSLLKTKAAAAESTFEKMLSEHMKLVEQAADNESIQEHNEYLGLIEDKYHASLAKLRARIMELERDPTKSASAVTSPQNIIQVRQERPPRFVAFNGDFNVYGAVKLTGCDGYGDKESGTGIDARYPPLQNYHDQDFQFNENEGKAKTAQENKKTEKIEPSGRDDDQSPKHKMPIVFHTVERELHIDFGHEMGKYSITDIKEIIGRVVTHYKVVLGQEVLQLCCESDSKMSLQCSSTPETSPKTDKPSTSGGIITHQKTQDSFAAPPATINQTVQHTLKLKEGINLNHGYRKEESGMGTDARYPPSQNYDDHDSEFNEDGDKEKTLRTRQENKQTEKIETYGDDESQSPKHKVPILFHTVERELHIDFGHEKGKYSITDIKEMIGRVVTHYNAVLNQEVLQLCCESDSKIFLRCSSTPETSPKTNKSSTSDDITTPEKSQVSFAKLSANMNQTKTPPRLFYQHIVKLMEGITFRHKIFEAQRLKISTRTKGFTVSSLREFYATKDPPNSLIDLIIEILRSQGTYKKLASRYLLQI